MDTCQAPFVGYFSVIPGSVRNDDGLSATAKLFFGDIVSMSTNDGYCYASNAYFSERFGLTERTVTRTIRLLCDRGHIKVRICRNRKTGQITGRRIYPLYNPGVPEEDEIEGESDEVECSENDENVASSHPTKMSAPVDKNVDTLLTKMSTGNIMMSKKEIYIPPISPTKKRRKKSEDDTAAREQFKAWAASRYQGQELAELTERLMQFCDMRAAKGNTFPAGRAVTALTGKLLRFSWGCFPAMLELLDKAIISKWDSVYALKEDELKSFGIEVVPVTPAQGEAYEKWV